MARMRCLTKFWEQLEARALGRAARSNSPSRTEPAHPGGEATGSPPPGRTTGVHGSQGSGGMGALFDAHEVRD